MSLPPPTLLVDNGSLEPAATLALRELAAIPVYLVRLLRMRGS